MEIPSWIYEINEACVFAVKCPRALEGSYRLLSSAEEKKTKQKHWQLKWSELDEKFFERAVERKRKRGC